MFGGRVNRYRVGPWAGWPGGARVNRIWHLCWILTPSPVGFTWATRNCWHRSEKPYLSCWGLCWGKGKISSYPKVVSSSFLYRAGCITGLVACLFQDSIGLVSKAYCRPLLCFASHNSLAYNTTFAGFFLCQVNVMLCGFKKDFQVCFHVIYNNLVS